MSKTAQQIVIILGVLLLVASGIALSGWMLKAGLEKDKISLSRQIDDYGVREKSYLVENKNLKDENKNIKDKLAEIEKAKSELEAQLVKFRGVKIDEIDKQIKKLAAERDEWKGKVESLSAERDKLVSQLTTQSAAAQQAVTSEGKPAEPKPIEAETVKAENPKDKEVAAQQEQDSYWAVVLKEKADLQLRLDNLGATLNETNVELVELRKKNSDLQMSMSEMKSDKEAIEREIKHGKDLADSLSLELARAQNEKKFLNDRVEKLLQENSGLRDQIKQLSSTKIALEKSLVRLQDEKKETEKKLVETENVIQSRVDQIWSIKESLDKDLKPKAKDAGQVELPPIVVSSQAQVANPSVDRNVGAPPGYNGNIVSINKDNNFVIVDIGDAAGLRVGDTLSVYRGTEYVAGLEVIQLRKDIAAADIKDRVSEIQIGDVVR